MPSIRQLRTGQGRITSVKLPKVPIPFLGAAVGDNVNEDALADCAGEHRRRWLQ